MTRDAVWRLLCWSLVAAWLVVIWQFGESQVLLLPPSDAADAVRVWLLRKGLHLAVYGVLGGLLALALGPERRWGWIVSLCLFVAFGDELHQSTVPHRSFHVYDLNIDLLGAVIGASFWQRIVNLTALWRREDYSRV